MLNRVVLRFALLALFLVAVAVVAGFLNLGTTAIVAVMAAAWLLVAAVEWMFSREGTAPTEPQAAFALEGPAGNGDEAPAEPDARRPFWRRRRSAEAEVGGAGAEWPEHDHVRIVEQPRPRPEPVEPGPAAEAEPASEPEAEPEPARATEPEPEPSPEATPGPEPEPEPAPPAAAAAAVGAPREWNLEQLQRLAAERAGQDLVRDEEWSFLFVYLREFASTDGLLPVDFDGLVRESFGELVADAERT